MRDVWGNQAGFFARLLEGSLAKLETKMSNPNPPRSLVVWLPSSFSRSNGCPDITAKEKRRIEVNWWWNIVWCVHRIDWNSHLAGMICNLWLKSNGRRKLKSSLLTCSDSMPMNQSGDGINFVTNETSEFLLSTKSRDSTESNGSLNFGMINSSNMCPLSTSPFSHSSKSAFSQNSFRPAYAIESILKRLKLLLWETPKDFENWAGGRTSGKCLGKCSRLQCPSSVTL